MKSKEEWWSTNLRFQKPEIISQRKKKVVRPISERENPPSLSSVPIEPSID